MFKFTNAYGSYNVELHLRSYSNGRLAIYATDEDGCPAFKATVNLPEFECGTNQAFIKDYSENEGVLRFLLDNKIATLIKYVDQFPLCEIDLTKLNEGGR